MNDTLCINCYFANVAMFALFDFRSSFLFRSSSLFQFKVSLSSSLKAYEIIGLKWVKKTILCPFSLLMTPNMEQSIQEWTK